MTQKIRSLVTKFSRVLKTPKQKLEETFGILGWLVKNPQHVHKMPTKEKSDEYEIWMEIWLSLKYLDKNSDQMGN